MRLPEQSFNPEYRQVDFELARSVSSRLTSSGIDFCVFSGFHATLLGQHRETSDIDFWADHQKWDELVAIFPEGDIKDRRKQNNPNDPYDGILITLGKGDIAVMSGTVIVADKTTYPSPFTDLVRENRIYQNLNGLETWYANPADTLLFKAISQRGRDKGKYDIDDIIAINKSTPIDRQYLIKRIIECQAESRVIPLLIHLGVLEESDLRRYTETI